MNEQSRRRVASTIHGLCQYETVHYAPIIFSAEEVDLAGKDGDGRLDAPNRVGAWDDGVGRPANESGGDLHLGGNDQLVGAWDARRASAQKLRGPKSRHHGEFEPGHSRRMMHETLVAVLR